MENKELKDRIKKSLLDLYNDLNSIERGVEISNTKARDFYRKYEKLLSDYRAYKSQNFHIESWKIEMKIGKENDSALRNIKDDVVEIYSNLFGENLDLLNLE
jgi:hypothetical protein